MIYRFKTKKALKFWLWLSCALDAMMYCLFAYAKNGDTKLVFLGAAAMVLQIVHGVRVAFFNKTLVNMSPGFCKFQFWLLLFFAFIAACSMGGTYGNILFAAAAVQLAVSAVISKRREIAEAIKEFLII